MTPEERIDSLETQCKRLNNIIEQMATIIQFQGGSNRMFENSVLALIRAHPDRAALLEALEDQLARCHSEMVFRAESEAHLQGGEAARTVLLACASSRHTGPQR